MRKNHKKHIITVDAFDAFDAEAILASLTNLQLYSVWSPSKGHRFVLEEAYGDTREFKSRTSFKTIEEAVAAYNDAQ